MQTVQRASVLDSDRNEALYETAEKENTGFAGYVRETSELSV